MRIEANKATSHAAPERRENRSSKDAARETDAPREVAALPAVRPQDRPQHQPRGGYAPLVAQLIATKLEMPQTRARRRATPETAINAYAGVSVARPAPSRLTRSV